MGTRVGDNAELALIELVDYNEIYGKGVAGQKETAGKRSRRGGGRGKKGAAAVEGTPSPVADAEATSPEATSPEVTDATALTDETNSKETPAV